MIEHVDYVLDVLLSIQCESELTRSTMSNTNIKWLKNNMNITQTSFAEKSHTIYI